MIKPLETAPLIAPLVGHASNRIRSKEQEVKNNEQGLSNKEEVVMIKEVEVITRCIDGIENKNETENKDTSAETTEGIKDIIKVFEENIQVISPFVYEKILAFTKKVSCKVIIMAIYEAVNYNAKTMKYIFQILNSWISNDIKTESQVIAYQKLWINKKGKKLGQGVKSGGFCDYEQREYDFDILEKRLLGQL